MFEIGHTHHTIAKVEAASSGGDLLSFSLLVRDVLLVGLGGVFLNPDSRLPCILRDNTAADGATLQLRRRVLSTYKGPMAFQLLVPHQSEGDHDGDPVDAVGDN